MIQLNLLPDVKLEYLRAQRTRRLAISVSALAAAIAVGLLVLLLIVDGIQYKHLQDLSHSIANERTQLQDQPQINKVLTVQNQLESLSALHSQKPAVTRIFNYLNEVTPSSVSVTSFQIDFTQQTVSITGTASSLASVNQYVDTLKLTTYGSGAAQSTHAFSNVVLSSFGLTSGQGADYTITLTYDKNIFDITQNPTLTVPSTTTTRLEVDNPTDLFQTPASAQNGGGQ